MEEEEEGAVCTREGLSRAIGQATPLALLEPEAMHQPKEELAVEVDIVAPLPPRRTAAKV